MSAPATTSNQGTSAAPVPRQAGWRSRRRSWGVKLHVMTTFFLMGLLIFAIAACGFIFAHITGQILLQNKRTQVRQLTYSLAAPLGGDVDDGPVAVKLELAKLHDVPQLDFVAITRPDGRPLAKFQTDSAAWSAFNSQLGKVDAATSNLGEVGSVDTGGRQCFICKVPLFKETEDEQGSRAVHLQGYLLLGLSNSEILSQLRYLRACVLLTCMGVVLVSIPIALGITRYITVPIGKLAGVSLSIAAGDFSHRATVGRRGDEIGDLAAAFNRMLDKVQTQQDEIVHVNAGLERKVLERTGELEKVNHRLQAEMSEKEDFLRAVSHDLNAPLRNISGMASMLILKYRSSLEKDALQRLERIQKNVEIECELINELLELSRIKSQRERMEQVDLQEMVTALGDQFSNDFETKQIAFVVRRRLPVMQCERGRMRQVFQNLIDNAIKYMRTEGQKRITIDVTDAAENVEFSISDTGMGIAAEDLPHLFHVFRRAKNASMLKIPGKGVGLASVKSIVENHGGRIHVESQVGVGTTFFMSLPKTYFIVQAEEVCV